MFNTCEICGQNFERVPEVDPPLHKDTLLLRLELVHGDADRYTTEEGLYQFFPFDINVVTKLYLVCEALQNKVELPHYGQDFDDLQEIEMWAELLKAAYGEYVESKKLVFLEEVLKDPQLDDVWVEAAVQYPSDPWMREAALWVNHELFETLSYDQEAIKAGIQYLPGVEALSLTLFDPEGNTTFVRPVM